MINILIVEDHAVVRAGLEQLLKSDGQIAVMGMARNGAQALELLSSGLQPDLILTDLHLGDMTGIELSRQISEQIPDIEIIILTMDTDERHLSEAFGTGIKGFLLKETPVDELIYGIYKVNEGKHFICTGLTRRLSQMLTRMPSYHTSEATDIELSRREAEILELLGNGYTNLEIADKLFTSRRTVEGHRQSLLNKTGVRNTPELIKYAMMHGLLQVQPVAV